MKAKEFKEFNCKKRCGKCCIIAQLIALTKAEVKSKLYKMRKAKRNKDKIEIVRKLLYIPEVAGNKLVCYYYEPEEKICLIYDHRPIGCKHFNCADYPKNNADHWLEYYKQINLSKND